MKSTGNITDRLLDRLFSDKKSTDGEMTEVIQGWVEARQDDPLTDAGLFDRFEGSLNRKPAAGDRYTRESLRRLQRELHFQTVAPTSLVRRRSFRLAVAGMAASAVVAGALILPTFFSQTPLGGAPAMVAVAGDSLGAREVTLPDGSTVKLRRGTTLSWAEDFQNHRAITLDGEAFFTVKRDERHPFTVASGEVTVTVLGTEFNVEAWNGGAAVEVVLVSGSVEVRSGESVEVLKPAERATIDRASRAIDVAEIAESEIQRVRGVNLSFDDVTLDEAFSMIADFYGVRVEAERLPELDGIVVRMADGASLEQTLYMIQQVNPVFEYAVEGDRVTIRGK